MRRPREDFQAGLAGMVILIFVMSVITSHGHVATGRIDWGDVTFFLFLMAIFASATIDLYKYFKRLP